ncbi:MAG: hypothetical protein IKO11_04235 [Lachnospiraceae bacterium]|nr:hypothetical protein [Lachnospiraceae bacterium]MBR4122181.1 hypothetical protein [Erysipelotrichaceae bacterium]
MENVFLYLACALFALICTLTVNFTLVILTRKEKHASETEMISGTIPEFYLKDPQMFPEKKGFL